MCIRFTYERENNKELGTGDIISLFHLQRLYVLSEPHLKEIDNKKAQHPVELFYEFTSKVKLLSYLHIPVFNLSLLFYVLEHPALYVPIV